MGTSTSSFSRRRMNSPSWPLLLLGGSLALRWGGSTTAAAEGSGFTAAAVDTTVSLVLLVAAGGDAERSVPSTARARVWSGAPAPVAPSERRCRCTRRALQVVMCSSCWKVCSMALKGKGREGFIMITLLTIILHRQYCCLFL